MEEGKPKKPRSDLVGTGLFGCTIICSLDLFVEMQR